MDQKKGDVENNSKTKRERGKEGGGDDTKIENKNLPG